jgi:hypothetical protein
VPLQDVQGRRSSPAASDEPAAHLTSTACLSFRILALRRAPVFCDGSVDDPRGDQRRVKRAGRDVCR